MVGEWGPVAGVRGGGYIATKYAHNSPLWGSYMGRKKFKFVLFFGNSGGERGCGGGEIGPEGGEGGRWAQGGGILTHSEGPWGAGDQNSGRM